MNPLLESNPPYPFARLLEIKRRREEAGHRVLDFGMGDPRDPTPEFLRAAVGAAVPVVSSYPTVAGRASLRAAITGYLRRRFDVELDADRHVLPLNGTKEGVFTVHLALLDPAAEKRDVVVFEPAYPVYARGVQYAGGRVVPVVLKAEHGFRPLPDLIPEERLANIAAVWVNSPHNPTGAALSAEEFARWRELARRHDFLLLSDECYADLHDGTLPESALVREDTPEHKNVLAFHSCSKRSCMTGYRTGFVAGDPHWIDLLKRFRPSLGVATPDFVQAVAEKAWNDDAHVAEINERYRRRRKPFLDLFQRKGWHHDGGSATFYLWLRVPEGYADSVAFAERLLEENVLVTPGAYLGAGGEQHIRFALVATEEDSEEAVRRMEAVS